MEMQSLSCVVTWMQGWDPCPLTSTFDFPRIPLRFCQQAEKEKNNTHSGGPLHGNSVAQMTWDTHSSPLHTPIHHLQLYSGELVSGYSLKVRGVCLSLKLFLCENANFDALFFKAIRNTVHYEWICIRKKSSSKMW